MIQGEDIGGARSAGPLGCVAPSSWGPPGCQAWARPLSYVLPDPEPPPLAAEGDGSEHDPAAPDEPQPTRDPEPFAEYRGWVRELWLHGWEGPVEDDDDEEGTARERAARTLLGRMAALAGGGKALDLRLARLLAWFRQKDLSHLGYPSFAVFMRERSDWARSQTYQLMRLASCGLPRIQAAVCLGLISFEQAFSAVGEIGPDEQIRWLQDALAGRVEAWREKRPQPDDGPEPLRWAVDLQGEQLTEIREARHLAHLCIGRPVSDEQADRYILKAWRARRPGKEILAEARQAPPVPDVGESSWCDAPDPATPLVGPWEEPRDPQHGLQLLERVQRVRRMRVLALGRAYQIVVKEKLCPEMGYHSLGGLAKDGLGLSKRSLERLRALALLIDELVPVRQAVARGLDLDRARIVADISCEEDVEDWLCVARWTGKGELRRAVRAVGSSKRVARELLAQYRQAIELARELVPGAAPMGIAPVEDEEATETGSGAQREATGTGRRPPAPRPGPMLAVALRAVLAPPPQPRWETVNAHLPVAARWFLENVKPEPQKGFGKVKERDDFRCQNPECRRRTLRTHAHHKHQRQEGGDDSPGNGDTLCPSCHLRLIHAGRVAMEEIHLEGMGLVLVWRYPGRVVVVL